MRFPGPRAFRGAVGETSLDGIINPFTDVEVAPSTSSSSSPAAQAVDLDVESELARFQHVEMCRECAAHILSQVAIQQATERTQAGLLAS